MADLELGTLEANALLKGIGETARSRFAAAKRLGARDQKYARLTSFASAFVIVLTVLPYFFPREKVWVDVVNLLCIGMALIILVSSMLQYSRVDGVSAEQHHRCGLELNELRRELIGCKRPLGSSEYLSFTKRYGEILQKYSLNHDDIDYLAVKIDRPHEYPWINRPAVFFSRLKIGFGKSYPDMFLAVILLSGFLTSYLYLEAKSCVESQEESEASTTAC